ncbi:MAG: PDGLE domain-containing protein [Deltaproteobacteria bacterium]|nr:PDGLE domain-containing protein [Deltaproteobacteria bacterium]
MGDAMTRTIGFALAGLVVAAAVAVVASPFASSAPDGLERVAEDFAFADHAANSAPATAMLPDYAVPGVASPRWSTALAGLAGTFATFGIGIVVSRTLANRKRGS